MKTAVCVVLEIEHEGDPADVFDAVARVLDDGLFQESINDDGNGSELLVKSAVVDMTPVPGSSATLAAVERAHIQSVVAAHGNKSAAARALGIDRRTLYRKLSKAAEVVS